MINKGHTRQAGIIAAVIVAVSTVSALVPGAGVHSEQSTSAVNNMIAAPTKVFALPHWEADNFTDPVAATPVAEAEKPADALCAPGGTEYTVMPGDTLSIVAGLCGTTIDVLAVANGLHSPYMIYVGDVLQRQGEAPVTATAAVAAFTAPASNSGIEGVIAFAMAQLGEAYVWGAIGPDVWDCSGLTMGAYNSIGINITRTTYTQVNQGYAVSNIQRGDLVFPSDGHVGIALGDGTMIHAPQTGDVVKITPIIYFGGLYAVRRIL
jgi:LysM repeat protein